MPCPGRVFPYLPSGGYRQGGLALITLWHNPRCSKSRAALKLLADRGVETRVRLYLADPPSREEIDRVLHKLGLPASAIVRTGETLYRALRLDEVESDADLLSAMAEYPILIERRIAIRGVRAVIGRPPEDVLRLLD